MQSLFVHHAASSLVASDARWRSIGENISNFSPCKRTEIISVGIDEEDELDTSQRIQYHSQGLANHGLVIDEQDSSRRGLLSRLSREQLPSARPPKRNHAMADEHPLQVCTDSQGGGRDALRTPTVKRRRLASRGSFQVPFTGDRLINRVPGESIVCCPSSDLPDVTLSFLQPQAISSSVKPSPKRGNSKARDGSELQSSPWEQQSSSLDLSKLRQSPTVRDIGRISVKGSRRSTRAGKSPDTALRSFSTVTHECSSPSPPSTESGEISDESERGDCVNSEGINSCIPDRAEIFGPVSSPELGKSGDEDQMDRSRTNFETILQLSRTVECQVPSSAERRHRSYIPASLSKVGAKYDLQNRFRPRTVSRHIGKAERGYWRLLIRVSTAADARRARGGLTSTSQRSDLRFLLRQQKKITDETSPRSRESILQQAMFPPVDPTAFTAWSESEFLQTFRGLEKLIVKGRLGWGIRLIIEETTPRDAFVDMNVRLYMFGEMVAHTWLVLMGLSDGLVGDLPMVWVSQGEPVVTMTGRKSRGGKLGPWLFWDDGDEGFCGVAAVKRSSFL